MTGEEIQRRLVDFALKWRNYEGTEVSEAQTFLNQLFECYGTNRRDAGARFEDPQAGGGILDLLWPQRCLVEMKRPSEAARLPSHRPQALAYWRNAADSARNVRAPRF